MYVKGCLCKIIQLERTGKRYVRVISKQVARQVFINILDRVISAFNTFCSTYEAKRPLDWVVNCRPALFCEPKDTAMCLAFFFRKINMTVATTISIFLDIEFFFKHASGKRFKDDESEEIAKNCHHNDTSYYETDVEETCVIVEGIGK